VVGIAALVCVVVLSLVRLWGPASEVVPSRHPEVRGIDPALEQAPDNAPKIAGAHEDSSSPNGERSASIAIHTVVDEAGSPISDAVVSWTMLDGPLSAWAEWSPADLTEAVRAASQTGRTSENGTYDIRWSPAARGAPAVLWVTHPGHLAFRLVIEAAWTGDPLPARIELKPAAPLEVRAVDGARRSCSDARFLQRIAISERMRQELAPLEIASLAALHREVDASGDGSAVLADLGHRQLVNAATDVAESEPWLGVAPDRIEFVLLPRFSWGGVVSLEDPSLSLSGSRVEIFAEVGGTSRWLDAAKVAEDGRFGPRRSPAIACDSLRFELLGGTVVPTALVRPAASAGEFVEVNLTGRSGLRFPVLAQAADGAPITSAEVSWAWQVGDDWQWSERFTRADGVAVLEAAPAGALWLVVKKQGYIESKQQLQLWSDVSPHYPVTLDRGGTLRGMVKSGNQPVTRFSIVHRSATDYSDLATVNFHDRKDGTFVIEGIPFGDRSVFAVGEVQPRSADQYVSVSADSTTEANFTLRPGAVGRGVVRVMQTGEPVSQAQVQNWISEGGVRVREFGPMAVTDEAGRFEMGGLAVGESNAIEVTHAGFAAAYLVVTGSEHGTQDLGVVAMAKAMSLKVILKLPDGEDATQWRGAVHGVPAIAARPFPMSGVLDFEGLLIATYDVEVHHGIRRSDAKRVLVTADARNEVTFDWRSGVEFELELACQLSSVKLEECVVRIYSETDGWRAGSVRAMPVPASGIVPIERIQGPSFDVAVTTRDGRHVGSARLQAELVNGKRVRVDLESSGMTIRVLDGRGSPTVDVVVAVGTASTGWRQSFTTDTNGEARFHGLLDDVIDVCVLRPGRGGGLIRGIRCSEAPIEITFEPRATIAVRLMDGADPIAGTPIWLWDGFGLGVGFETLVSGLDGAAKLEACLPQRFVAEVRQPGLWHAKVEVDASDPAKESVIQVRRRGSVILHAKRGGLALAGARIEVESEEFSTPVASWIASGEVTASDPSSSTDTQGRLRLDGLPRGPYRWAVRLDDGSTVGGRFDVEPQRRVDVDVLLP